MIQIINNFPANVVQKIALDILFEKVQDGELTKKFKLLVDNFF